MKSEVSAHLMDANKVKIWTFDLDVASTDENSFAAVLTDAELDRASRFRFEKLKRRFIAGRGGLRMILACYLEIDPVELAFTYSKLGKPTVLGSDGELDLKFSTTNASNLGAVAISSRIELGFDLEKIKPANDQMLVVESQFCDEEITWFKSLLEAERMRAFFELWTSKEAYLKGKGLGLSAPLNSFYISMQEPVPRLVWSEIDRADPDSWCMSRPVIQKDFTSCLAVQSNNYSVVCEHWSL